MGRSTYIFGHLSLMAITFFFSLIAAHELGPKQMGQWQTVLLISSYAPILYLGVVNGLGRDIPYRLGKKASVTEPTAIASKLILSLVSILALGIPAVSYILNRDPSFLIVAIVALSAGRIINVFSTILLRSHQRFVRLGYHQLTSAVVLTIFMLILIWAPSLRVLAIGMMLAYVVPVVFSISLWSLEAAPLSAGIKLVRIGFPIYLAGLIFSLLNSVDRWLILLFLDKETLGLYTLAIMAFGVVIIVPSLLSTIVYPKLAFSYGENHSIKDLIPTIRRVIVLNTTLTVAIAGIGFIAMYFFVIPMFLPEYLYGRDAMAIIFLSSLVLPVGQSFGDLLNVIGMHNYYLRNISFGFVLNMAVGITLLKTTSLGINGVAIGTVTGLSAFSAAQYITYRNSVLKNFVR